jgi:hypothetical protein
VLIQALGPIGELVHVQLAEHDAARGDEPGDHGGVLVGHPVREDLRSPGGLDALGAVEILEPDRHAV